MTRYSGGIWAGVASVLMLTASARECDAQILPTDPADSGRLGNRSPDGLGPSPGDNGSQLGQNPAESAGILMNRPGRPGPRISTDTANLATPDQTPASYGIANPTPLRVTRPPVYGPLELPEGDDDLGPADGLTIDQAIERLVRDNLDLKTQFFEIPQAEADVLTAGLRANPLFYADSTAVPYGAFSPRRPGGQTQYDIGVTWPFDLSHKRQSRTLVAVRAKRVLEQWVLTEVFRADQEYDVTRGAVEQIEAELIPAARQVRDTEFRRYIGGEVNILAYLDAQRQYNDTVRQYRDMVTRHRRSMLDLNTALGLRVLP